MYAYTWLPRVDAVFRGYTTLFQERVHLRNTHTRWSIVYAPRMKVIQTWVFRRCTLPLFRQTLFRQMLFRQSTVGTSDGWLQLNRPTGSKDWKDAEPNPKKNQGQYNNDLDAGLRCNFAGGGGTLQTHQDTLPRPRFPQSPRCLDQCRALHACNASTPSNFSPISAYD